MYIQNLLIDIDFVGTDLIMYFLGWLIVYQFICLFLCMFIYIFFVFYVLFFGREG